MFGRQVVNSFTEQDLFTSETQIYFTIGNLHHCCESRDASKLDHRSPTTTSFRSKNKIWPVILCRSHWKGNHLQMFPMPQWTRWVRERVMKFVIRLETKNETTICHYRRLMSACSRHIRARQAILHRDTTT